MVKTGLLFRITFDTIRNMKLSNLTKFVTIAAAALAFASCQTAPTEIPQDLSALQLIQRGQDAMARENYKTADAYYVACIDRFSDNPKTYVEARYELAQSNYKQKKYDMAKKMYQEILDIFENPNAIYQVQTKYKKLSQMGIDRITEIENKKAIEAEKKAAKKAAREAKKNNE